MRRSSLRLAAASLLVATASSAVAKEFRVVEGPGGCSRLRGHYALFLLPEIGSLLVSSQPFPGATEAGAVNAGELRVGLPNAEAVLRFEGIEGRDLWTMVDRSFVPPSAGCFAFGERRFTTVDDLKTYLHWVQRDLLVPLVQIEGVHTDDPEDPLIPLSKLRAAPAITLGSREVSFDVETDGQAVMTIHGLEGRTTGVRLEGASRILFLMPFVVGDSRLAVRVFMKDGPYFGGGSRRDLGLHVVETDVWTPVSLDEGATLRLRVNRAGP